MYFVKTFMFDSKSCILLIVRKINVNYISDIENYKQKKIDRNKFLILLEKIGQVKIKKFLIG